MSFGTPLWHDGMIGLSRIPGAQRMRVRPACPDGAAHDRFRSWALAKTVDARKRRPFRRHDGASGPARRAFAWMAMPAARPQLALAAVRALERALSAGRRRRQSPRRRLDHRYEAWVLADRIQVAVRLHPPNALAQQRLCQGFEQIESRFVVVQVHWVSLVLSDCRIADIARFRLWVGLEEMRRMTVLCE